MKATRVLANWSAELHARGREMVWAMPSAQDGRRFSEYANRWVVSVVGQIRPARAVVGSRRWSLRECEGHN